MQEILCTKSVQLKLNVFSSMEIVETTASTTHSTNFIPDTTFLTTLSTRIQPDTTIVVSSSSAAVAPIKNINLKISIRKEFVDDYLDLSSAKSLEFIQNYKSFVSLFFCVGFRGRAKKFFN